MKLSKCKGKSIKMKLSERRVGGREFFSQYRGGELRPVYPSLIVSIFVLRLRQGLGSRLGCSRVTFVLGMIHKVDSGGSRVNTFIYLGSWDTDNETSWDTSTTF